MAEKYPQESYTWVAHAIQSEWIFLQRMSKNTEDVFAGVDNLLWETFLPCIFFRKPKSLPPIAGILSMTPVNKSGLGLQNLVTSADEKYLSFQRASTELIR